MKKIVLITFLILGMGLQTWAQRPGMDPNKRPKIGIVSGRVFDQLSGKPVEYATVALFSQRSGQLVSGTITKRDGSFRMEELPLGKHNMKVEFMGYQSLEQSVVIQPKKTEVTFNKLKLSPSAEALSGVEITADKMLFENKIDKKVINVTKDVVSEGASAVEVLENVPSVDVDTEGNISLRGSENVKVLLDGKPSGLSAESAAAMLEQLPSSAIQSIELITNPSSKYDPEGMVGIINVVLKKNKLQGVNGSLMAGLGTNGNGNGSVSLNTRNHWWTLNSMLAYRDFSMDMDGTNIRKTWAGEETLLFDQQTAATRGNKSLMARLSGDFMLNSTNTLSWSAGLNKRDRNMDENSLYKNYLFPDEPVLFYRGINQNELDGASYDLNLNYEKQFSSRDHYLQIDGVYSSYDFDKTGVFEEMGLDFDLLPTNQATSTSQNITNSGNTNLQFSIDYAQPIGEKSKWEAGARSIDRSVDNDFLAGSQDPVTQLFVNDPAQSNHFAYNEQIHAVYSQYAHDFGFVSMQAGLRYERVFTKSDLKTTGQIHKKDYSSWYPSFFLMKSLDKKNELKLNYSRRVNRPRGRMLNPFGNTSDPMNIRRGNPDLNPEYTHLAELSYTHYTQLGTLSASAFYRYTTDKIERITNVEESGVSVMSFENLSNSAAYGLEAVAGMRFFKLWRANLAFNMSQTELNNTAESLQLNNKGVNWNVKLNNNIELPWNLSAQLTAAYYAPRIMAQGESDPSYWCDLGLKKTFLNRKGSVSLRIRDIFDTRKFGGVFEGPTYFQEISHEPDFRVAYLTVSYRFGKMSMNKKKANRSQEQGGDDMDMMDF